MTTISSQICTCHHESCPPHIQRCCAISRIHPIPRDSPKEGSNQQISISSQNQHFQPESAAPNQHQLLVSTTRQQHQISFQLSPPDSSTKSASASTTRQQHQISISFQLPPPGSSTTSAILQQGIQPISC